MKRLPVGHVVVIVAVLICATALAVSGHDNAGLITVGLALFGGLGVVGSQTQAVKEQTNGNTSQLVQLVRELAHMGFQSMPPPSPLPGSLSADLPEPEGSPATAVATAEPPAWPIPAPRPPAE